MAAHPELNGHIYFKTGDDRIWWIDGGLARWIVDEDTYHGVFGGSPNKVENDLLSDIDVGFACAGSSKTKTHWPIESESVPSR